MTLSNEAVQAMPWRVMETEKKLRDHEDRLRSLEKWRWQTAGILAVVSALGSALGAYLQGAL